MPGFSFDTANKKEKHVTFSSHAYDMFKLIPYWKG
ncbi:hypothetical protein BSNT_09460 [Bacillus subtilis subsp. natto BEST195]|nr:hypothetical protein BSNT_09460 [Bacillus subtilis subsp. natto BEST195]